MPHRPHKPAARRAAYCSRSLSRRATRHGSHTVPSSMGGCVPQRVHVRASRRARSRRLPLSRANERHPFRVSAAVWYASRLGLRASCALGLAPFFAAVPAQGPIGHGPRLPAPRTHATGDPLGGNAFIPPPPARAFFIGIFVWHVPSFRGCSPDEGRPAGRPRRPQVSDTCRSRTRPSRDPPNIERRGWCS